MGPMFNVFGSKPSLCKAALVREYYLAGRTRKLVLI